MKKFLLIVLTVLVFIGANGSTFASSKRTPTIEGVRKGMRKGFGFLVKTRDESVLNPETIQKRRNMENLIIRTYREGHRDLLLQVYDEQVEGFKNEIRNDREGRVHLYQDCLRELSRIRSLMVGGSK